MKAHGHHIGRSFALVFLWAGALHGGEFALLTSGFRLHADRHELAGDRVKLFEGSGSTEVAAAEVSAFEPEERAAPSPAPVSVPVAAPAPASSPADLYERVAAQYGLPPALVRSIVRTESNYRPDAVSPKGAIGLMQLMPGTAKILGADPRDPEQNVDAGTRYLRELLARYEANDDQVARAIAAYNAGPGAVDRYKGIPPYRETQTYVRRVLLSYLKLKANDN